MGGWLTKQWPGMRRVLSVARALGLDAQRKSIKRKSKGSYHEFTHSALRLNRLFELFSDSGRLFLVRFFRRDPALPAIFITETSSPIRRFRVSSNAGHPQAKEE
jgi:hypothetical protein